MNAVLDVIKLAMKGGFKTSEFWLAALAILVPFADTLVQHAQTYVAGLPAPSPLVALGKAVAAAIIASVYAVVRSRVKRDGAQAASIASVAAANATGTIPLGTNGNVLTPPPDGH